MKYSLIILFLAMFAWGIKPTGQLFVTGGISFYEQDTSVFDSLPTKAPTVGLEFAVPVVYDCVKFSLGVDYSFLNNMTDEASDTWAHFIATKDQEIVAYKNRIEAYDMSGYILRLTGGPYVELKNFIIGSRISYVRNIKRYKQRVFSHKYPYENHIEVMVDHYEQEDSNADAQIALLAGLKFKRASLLCSMDMGSEVGLVFRWEALRKKMSKYSVKETPFQ